MFWKKRNVIAHSERCYLRLPVIRDYTDWVNLRRESEDFLTPWEPERDRNFYSMGAFKARVKWSKKSFKELSALPTFIFSIEDGRLLGAVTLDNLKKGASRSGSVGYWVGKPYARNGYMTEALNAIKIKAFNNLNISRLEAATLPDNHASRRLLEKVGFKYEGVAQSYLQIDGRWRNHVMYSLLRNDRRGRPDRK